MTANPVPNPTVPLPLPAEEVVRGVDGVLVTHRHQDHLDDRAKELLPRDVPVFRKEVYLEIRDEGTTAGASARSEVDAALKKLGPYQAK